MTLEIQVFVWDRYKNVEVLNQIMGSQPSSWKLNFQRQFIHKQMIKKNQHKFASTQKDHIFCVCLKPHNRWLFRSLDIIRCLQPQTTYFCTNVFEYYHLSSPMFNMLWYSWCNIMCSNYRQRMEELSGIISDVLDEKGIENYITFLFLFSFVNGCSIH